MYFLLFNKRRVVAVDLRGYGQSEKPAGRSAYHYDTLVEDIRQIITLLGKFMLVRIW